MALANAVGFLVIKTVSRMLQALRFISATKIPLSTRFGVPDVRNRPAQIMRLACHATGPYPQTLAE